MLPKNKSLIIFDFDQTLCCSNGVVKRKDNQSGVIDYLNAQDYVTWRIHGEYDQDRTRWDLDFAEFTGYPKRGTPIEATIKLLQLYLADDEAIVALVTGRDELAGPTKWLQDQGVDTDKMILACTADPNKGPFYESLVMSLKPTAVVLYEDSHHHIIQCEQICNKYNVPFEGLLVFKDGDLYGINNI